MQNWLVYIHAANPRDMTSAQKSLSIMQKNLGYSTTVYVICFGPTLRSNVTLSYVTYNQNKVLHSIQSVDTSTVVPITKYMISIIKRYTITAVCFWCHGGAFICGPWKRWKEPFITTKNLVKCILDPLKPKLVCFDSCYMASMSCLYEIPDYVDIVVASSAFHPYDSIITTKSFGKLSFFGSKSDIADYAHKLNCEWHVLTRVRYKCMLVYDMKLVPLIAIYVKKYMPILIFDKESQLDKEDANLHDIFTAARNVPELQNIIQKSVRYNCDSCRTSCTEKANGMSMEKRIPKKWQKEYRETKWYKDVVGTSTTFALKN